MKLPSFRKLSPEALHAQLQAIIQTLPPGLNRKHPNGNVGGALLREELQWLGRARALVEETGHGLAMNTATGMRGQYPDYFAQQVLQILYQAIAVAELELPATPTDAFIPAGNALDALKAVERIISSAQSSLLIVDPYLDGKILTEFAEFAPSGTSIHLLTDESGVKATLHPAARAWKKQHETDRQLQVRHAKARSLHDRMIAIDQSQVWTVGQSFNALAARSPTSFVQVDAETAQLKLQTYTEIWSVSQALDLD
jgi:PLD-like domain